MFDSRRLLFSYVGLLLLWLKWKVRLSHNSSIGLFYPALLSLAIGIAGVEAAKAFLVLQFPDKELEEEVVAAVEAAAAAGDQFSQKKKLEEFERTIETRASVWWYAFISVGSIVASTFTSGLSWEKTLMVCFILMAVVYSFFCSGNRYYNKKPSTTSFTFLASKFKFRLLPLWTIFLVYSLFQAAGETFFIEQSDRLDDRVDIRIPIYSFNINRIPLSSFYILQNFTSFAISLLSDYLIENRWSTSATTQRLATCVRICFGMVLACGCCMMAWWVEIRRLKLIHDEAESGETQEEFLPMKILWLAPQFFLLGIVNGLVGEVQRHFFYERVPLRFMVFESPFNQALMCIGRFLAALSVLVARNWIHDSIEESRVDKYLLMLAILIFFILIIYIFLSCILDWNIKEEAQSCDQSLALPQELESLSSANSVMGGGAAGHDGGGGVDSDQMQIVGAENVETGSQLRDSGKLPITSPKLKEKGYEDSVLIAKNCGILLGNQVAGCLAERIGESNSVMGCSNNLGQQQALSQAQGAFIQNSGVGLFSPTTTSLPAKLQQKDGSSLVNENLQPAWDSAKDKLPTTVLEPREGKFSFVFGAGTSGGKKGTRRWKKAARVASTDPLTASEAVVQPHVGKNRCLEPQDEELNDGTEPVAAKKSKKQGEESVASGEASIT